MTLAVSHNFQPRQVIRSSEVNTDINEIVSYVNDLEDTLTSDIYALIPAGTKMVFYQASAPAGWTLVNVDDKFLRVVNGGGGGTGGTVAASTSLAHTHTVASHDHTLASHTHSIPNINLDTDGTTSSSASDPYAGAYADVNGEGSSLLSYKNTGGSVAVHFLKGRTATSTSGAASGNTGAATPSTDSQLGVFAYADVIICSKD
jgi:hypothetical protein